MFDTFKTKWNSDGAEFFEALGWFFQIPMMFLFGFLTVAYIKNAPTPLVLLGMVGTVLFLWCLYRLYGKRARLTGLVTTGPFRYTRHPMYLGLFIMSLPFLAPGPSGYTVLQVLVYLAFLVCLVVAALIQEVETLERFGQPAHDYYAQTPRIPFLG